MLAGAVAKDAGEAADVLGGRRQRGAAVQEPLELESSRPL